MNQFKKAKQKALQSGHQVENMADLQTAGIKQPVEENKPVDQPKEVIVEPTPVVVSEPVIPVEQPQENVAPEIIVNTPISSEPAQTKSETPVVMEEPVSNTPDPVYEEIEIPRRIFRSTGL